VKRFKRYVVLITLLVALLAGLIFYLFYDQPSFDFDRHDQYQVNTIDSLGQLEFGGEKIPVWNSRLKARYQREIREVKKKSREKALLLKRANTFFPTIERILANEGVPVDLKYVALVESRLLPRFSRKGAAGYWQIMPASARHLRLELNREVDERFHLEKSTRAMARLFREYKQRFGSWSNAAAAYNMGPEKLEKLLERQQDSMFYNLRVNAETSRFLFRILAYKALFEQPGRLGFRRISAYGRYIIRYTQHTQRSPLPSLEVFAKEKKLSLSQLKAANPWLRSNSLNLASDSLPRVILLPVLSDTSALIALVRPPSFEPEQE
jgi:hypothetical protein